MILEVVVDIEPLPGGAPTRLAGAWVYWKEAGTIAILRTDGAGQLRSLRSGGDASVASAYTEPFRSAAGTQVEVAFTLGARPLPGARVLEHPDVLATRTVQLGAPPPPSPTPPSPSPPPSPTATLLVPPPRIQVTKPPELSLWPVLWEPVHGDYATAGLPQKTALWHDPDVSRAKKKPPAIPKKIVVKKTAKVKAPRVVKTPPPKPPEAKKAAQQAPAATKPATGLKLPEGMPPKDPPPAAVRARERGVLVAGSVGAGATGVRVRILDRMGNPLPLRVAPGGGVADEVDAKLVGSPGGGMQRFSAKIDFAKTADAFGPVQIVARSQGLSPNAIQAISCHLAGVQIALVQDASDGQAPGSNLSEADEVVVVDFLVSPQPSKLALSGQARVRRMIRYVIGRRPRSPGSGTGAKILSMPEMPMWMAELHLVGVSQADFAALLALRGQAAAPAMLKIEVAWRLGLSWDGPDSGPLAGKRHYGYAFEMRANQTAQIELDAKGGIAGAGVQGEVANALRPPPTRIPFPVKDRRLPQVFVGGRRRRWGRRSDSPERDALVMEWQPEIVEKTKKIPGREIIRGGDGHLVLERLTIDGLREDDKQSPPDADLPWFRVVGTNPPAPVEDLIDALVEEYYNAHSSEARIQVLSLATWQTTVRMIVHHESKKKYQQFDPDPSGRWRWGGLWYGREHEMPLFGPPHGYGLGQIDSPPVTDDQAWSFIENVRGSVKLIMGNGRDDKAGHAYGWLSGHLHNPPTKRDRAVYQREIVRRYNGHTEFKWNALKSDWEIEPGFKNPIVDGKPNDLLTYPNDVLGTNVAYWTGNGRDAKFPWPIDFTEADYGPGL